VREASQPNFKLDYAADCFYDTEMQRLFLLAGSFEGPFHLCHIQGDTMEYCQSLVGHTDIVRAVTWDAKANVILTGGEDGKLCLWATATNQTMGAPPSLTLPLTSHKGQHREHIRFSPY